MSKIKLLIFGSKGWIGSQFLDYIKKTEEDNANFSYIETNVRADNDLLLNDSFIDIAYHEASLTEEDFNKSYDNLLEIGFIGVDNIKIDKIKSDGYVFMHEIK